MADRVQAALAALLRRREPDGHVLLELERGSDDAVDAMCALLDRERLSPRQQGRLLKGLSHAVKHAGPRAHLRVVKAALARLDTADVALRSRAAHSAVCGVRIVAHLRDPSFQIDLTAMRARVALAVRRAADLGLHTPTDALVTEFLREVDG